jgi:RNA polymerase sigma-70 factor (ECF subfamily)
MEIANRSVKSLNTPDPEQQAMAGELRRSLESAVDSLPDAYRSVFVFRSVEEMTVAETAACLEISEEAVKTRLHRARALIRRKLSEGAAATAGAFEFPAVRCDRVVAAVLRRLDAAV